MNKKEIIEKELEGGNGFVALALILLLFLLSTAGFVFGIIILSALLITLGIIGWIIGFFLIPGLKIVRPNEAKVFTIFGAYYGTISQSGFFFINPFSVAFSPEQKPSLADVYAQTQTSGKPQPQPKISSSISLKTQTLENNRQKVNDILGNPIIIGAIAIWRVDNPTKAVFSVENYKKFLSIQADTTIRNVARLYPYDIFDEDETNAEAREKTLRGSALEIAEVMKKELQGRVSEAGLIIEEVRITQLAYSEEIAAAMLQRQQAAAIIAARTKIVDGAVGMVKLAIDKLGEDEVVILDEERKAAMVSNLLVVLCGNQDAQPIVNSGSIY